MARFRVGFVIFFGDFFSFFFGLRFDNLLSTSSSWQTKKKKNQKEKWPPRKSVIATRNELLLSLQQRKKKREKNVQHILLSLGKWRFYVSIFLLKKKRVNILLVKKNSSWFNDGFSFLKKKEKRNEPSKQKGRGLAVEVKLFHWNVITKSLIVINTSFFFISGLGNQIERVTPPPYPTTVDRP